MTYEVEDSSDALVDCGMDATSPDQPDQEQGGQGQEGAAGGQDGVQGTHQQQPARRQEQTSF